MEIIDLQSDDLLKDKFQEMSLPHFYATLNDGTFPHLSLWLLRFLFCLGQLMYVSKHSPE